MKNMNLIINTHWDREYRWSFRETQYRLMEAIDELIDTMQKDEGFTYFHTDSQVSMLDDYLEVRPERAEEVKKLVSEGRILTGPWYTLPAEYLVNGEALVRNLLLGHKISGELGKTMKVAHNIFSWGQVSQLPQMYRLLGMDTITFYRGVNQSELDTLEFRWKGADDKESLVVTFAEYHRLNFWRYVYKPYILGGSRMIGDSLKNAFSRDDLGNSFMTQLCGESLIENNHWLTNQEPVRDLEGAKAGLEKLLSTVIDKSSTDEILFFQGFDLENADPIVPELVAKLNETIEDGKIEVASLVDWEKRFREKITPEIYAKLPVKSGEMLEVEKTGDAFGPLYNGVWSARMPIKLANAKVEYQLINGAEPIAGWHHMLGEEYPSIMLNHAWKELLKNQQHDGIAGCHVDRVSTTMLERYRETEDVAQTIIKKSLKQITGKIDFTELEDKEIGVVVYNTLPFERDDIVTCIVDVPLSWNLRYANRGRREISVEAVDMYGNQVPAQLLNVEDDAIYTYLKFGDTFDFDASRCRLIMQPGILPQNGYVTLRLKAKSGEERPVEFISPRANVLENENLHVKINNNGTLTVTEKSTGTVMENVHYFEDTSDKGGPLVFSPVYEQLMYRSLNENASVAMVYNGPLQSTYRITLRWKLPKCIETELKIHVPHGSEWIDQGRLQRSRDLEELVITTDVTLKKGANQLQFHTVVNNNIRDHRLRVMFETGLKDAMFCRADAPFDVMKREITVPDSSGWYEAAAKEWPSHSFVSVSDGNVEASVYHKGIPEYEVKDDDTRTIGLTLLRCIANAGNPTEVYEYQELAECQGVQEFDYWFAVTPGTEKDSTLAKRALMNNNPCYVMATTKHPGTLPHKQSFFEIENDDFIVSAVTEGTKKNSLLIRGYLLDDKEGCVKFKAATNITKVSKVNLDFEEMENLEIKDDNEVCFKAGKREMVTLSVEWGNENE